MLEQVRTREAGGAAASDGSGKFPDLGGKSAFFLFSYLIVTFSNFMQLRLTSSFSLHLIYTLT